MGGVILILLDSLMNFRLEYLYPVLMFIRSVYDSYKYQGFVSCFFPLPHPCIPRISVFGDFQTSHFGCHPSPFWGRGGGGGVVSEGL